MNSLVFLEPDSIKAIPFTTSDVIAEYAKIANRSVYLLIEKHVKQLEKFGRVSFEMRPSQTKSGIQEVKIYHLNKQQATILITFLKNTEPVINFKVELVRQFYVMRAELQKRQIGKLELKPTRRTLTDEIQDNPYHNEWDYKNLTNLIYKMVTGKIAVTLRKERGAKPKAVAIDYMTAEEIAQVEKFTYKIAVLYEMGLDYHQIKAMLLNRQMIGQIT